jgi:peroxiredoxin Q/BCP
MQLKIGDKAPNFTLPDQADEKHSLSDYLGKWVLIYFYPKDNTPGCTVESCALRDSIEDIRKGGAEVLGISTDSVKSHFGFADKYKLPFPILSDAEKEVVNLYGVWGKKKFMGREYLGTNRASFLIDGRGKIVKIYEKVKPLGHAKEVLKDLEALKIND